MGQPLFFERGCSPQVFFLTHMEIGEAPRAGFEEVARLARPKGRGNRNATTATSEKTIEIYLRRARRLGSR